VKKISTENYVTLNVLILPSAEADFGHTKSGKKYQFQKT